MLMSLPLQTSMKGPSNSVEEDGSWAPGLQKARVYERILLDIILGELAPMCVLEERVIAARYNSGLAGVREALGRLAIEGLAVRRPRVGTIVAPLDVELIEQAFEVRHMLEGRTAALAARNSTCADLVAISGAFQGADKAIAEGNLRAVLTMDRKFHRAVAFATKNMMLARYIRSLQNIATRFWIWEMERQTPDDQLRDVALHRELAVAISVRDPSAAETAAIKLVGNSPSKGRG
jgi:DNA-binding GntR family transcriptional regulator